MSSNHQLHRRAQSHSLFMGIIIAVFAVATIVSSCRNDGELSSSEQKEMLYYNNANRYALGYDVGLRNL